MSTVLEAAPATTPGLPESDELYEIVDGERVEKVRSAYAGWIAAELHDHLSAFLRGKSIGKSIPELVFVLDEERNLRRRPDVAFLSSEKWPVGAPPPPMGDWHVIPDIAVEVLSPSNRYEDVLFKLREYFHYGVREVWLISPAARVAQVFTASDKLRTFDVGESLASPLIPGWSIAIDTLLPHEAAPSVSDE